MDVINNMSEAGRKQLAVLVDPDKLDEKSAGKLATLCDGAGVDYIFAGGSLVMNYRMEEIIEELKQHTSIPIVIFPGNILQITPKADAILLLSLISGRNADMLIGRHIEAAPLLLKSRLEVIPTGYMLIDGGNTTSARYMSNTLPIPMDKPDIATCTAIAGQMMGLKTIYMDAGSGAAKPIDAEMIRAVKTNISIPLIVGGGIRTENDCHNACAAGADVIVVGNAIEKNLNLVTKFSEIIHKFSK